MSLMRLTRDAPCTTATGFWLQVPRMLLERSRLGELEAYIAAGGDPELVKWWAKYCESIGDHAAARLFYARAADHLSLVRL
jgi:intraflagellar transport protein 140